MKHQFFKRSRLSRELKRLAKQNAANGKPLSVLDDIVFKTMLTSDTDDSREALRCLLSACTKREVSKVKILNNELLPSHLEAKSPRLDVHVTFNDGEVADLEMQMSKSGDDLRTNIETLFDDEKWCIFMKYRNVEMAIPLIEELCLKEDGIMRAEKTITKVDKDLRRYARTVAEMKDNIDRMFEYERALKEGSEKAQLEIARKMKDAGLPINEITGFTGVSADTLETL